MADLEQILAKISALLAKTTAAGATEAFAAAAKARELIDKYQLASASAASPGPAGLVYVEALADQYGHTWRTAKELGRFTDCKIWLSGLGRAKLPNGAPIPTKVKILGLRADVELTHWLLTAIASFAQKEFISWLLDAEVEHAKLARESFFTGLCTRVTEQLNALASQREPSANALVPVKSSAQGEWLRANGINLRGLTTDPFGLSNGRAAGLAAGFAAGDRAPLGKSMSKPGAQAKLASPGAARNE